MRYFFWVSLILVGLAGCSGTIGGAGETSRGESVAGELIVRSRLDQAVLLRGARGWRCDGQLTEDQAREAALDVTVPVQCSDGRTGRLRVITKPFADPVARGSFRLSDGTTGQVVYTHLKR